MASDDDLLTTSQAAEVLGLSGGSVRRLVADGVIPAMTINSRLKLIRRGDLKLAEGRPTVGNHTGKPRHHKGNPRPRPKAEE